MYGDTPHRAAFLKMTASEPECRAFVLGYLVGHLADDVLCGAIQAWRGHEAALADLNDRDETIRDLDGNPVTH